MPLYVLKKKKNNHAIFSGYYNSFIACLEDAVRLGMDLSEIDLRNKNLSNGNLDSGYLPHADLRGANLSGVNLSEACLRGSRLQFSSLYNACLCYSDLRNCNFSEARFGGTDIAGCDIRNSVFSALSCFDLDFWHTEKMEGCSYIGLNGLVSPMTKIPYVIKGATNLPIIILDNDIHIGNKVLSKGSFSALMKLLERHIDKFELQREFTGILQA